MPGNCAIARSEQKQQHKRIRKVAFLSLGFAVCILLASSLWIGLLYLASTCINGFPVLDEDGLFLFARAVSNAAIGMALMTPFWLRRFRYKTNGVRTMATVEKIGHKWPSALLLRYDDHEGVLRRTLQTQVRKIDDYYQGQEIEIRFFRKRPELVVLSADRAILQKVLLAIGTLAFLVGSALVVLASLVA